MPVREKVYKIPSYLISTFLSFSKKICVAWNCSIKAPRCYMVLLRVPYMFPKMRCFFEYLVEKKSCSDCTVLSTKLTKPFFSKHNIC